MSTEDVERVREMVAAFNERDHEAIRALIDPEYEFRSALVGVEGEPYRGDEGFERYFVDLGETLEDWTFLADAYIDAGDGRVVVTGRSVGRGKGSRVPIEQPVGAVVTLRDGRLLVTDVLDEPEEALRMAGFEGDSDVARIREIDAAIGARDVGTVARHMRPDVVWEHNLGTGSPEEGVYRGRESVIALLERILDPWEYLRLQMRELHDLGGGRYLARGEMHAKHRTSEVEVEARYEQRLEIREGLVAKGQMTTGGLA